MKRIYLDYAATTPCRKEVVEKMNPYFADFFGNPASVHAFGQEAQEVLDNARFFIAERFKVDQKNVIFTSGATESNNLLIQSLVLEHDNPHVILGSNEHSSVHESVGFIEKNSGSASLALSGSEGLIEIDSIFELIEDQTVLVSVMMVNNEVGARNNVELIAQKISEINTERKERDLPFIHFHVDATQAIAYEDISFKDTPFSSISFSAHKLYGPKGVGCLILGDGITVDSLFFGGSQESGRRPGTVNIPGIVGMHAALEILYRDFDEAKNNIKNLKSYFIEHLLAISENVEIIGKDIQDAFAPHIQSVRFVGIDAEELFLFLDMNGVAVSRSSACSSSSTKTSHVLLSMGCSEKEAKEFLRFSFGVFTTKDDINATIDLINRFLEV